eukprot:scaffold296863_cov40-Tisochrysis_lutea.AAC.3
MPIAKRLPVSSGRGNEGAATRTAEWMRCMRLPLSKLRLKSGGNCSACAPYAASPTADAPPRPASRCNALAVAIGCSGKGSCRSGVWRERERRASGSMCRGFLGS